MEYVLKYINKIWEARHFWLHLALADLRIKFRRSRLGILWSFLQPLMLTLLLAFVFGAIFKSPFRQFAPFVFSGLIIWDFLTSSVLTGSNSIINGEAYIKQVKHPIVIYPLKQAIVNFTTFAIAFLGLLLWIVVDKPRNIPIMLLNIPISFLLLFILSWPLSIISAIINTKFRDFQQLIAIALQALWFVSPVYFEPKVFTSSGLGYLLDYNPITHILNLIRAPLLEGHFPSFLDYSFVIGTAIVLYSIAIYKVSREERDLIFYL